MDPEPPVKRNIFLIAVVILFNLIWLTLLFLSCQADQKQQPDLTPMVRNTHRMEKRIDPLISMEGKETDSQHRIWRASIMEIAYSPAKLQRTAIQTTIDLQHYPGDITGCG